jgi:hypothetical protein
MPRLSVDIGAGTTSATKKSWITGIEIGSKRGFGFISRNWSLSARNRVSVFELRMGALFDFGFNPNLAWAWRIVFDSAMKYYAY